MTLANGETPAENTATGSAPETTQAAPVVTPGATTPDTTNQGSTTAQPPAFNFAEFVPEQYKGKPWLENIANNPDPKTELFKQFENLQSLMGRKPIGVPGADATPEQKKEFYKSLGVPETPDAYTVEPLTWNEKDEVEVSVGKFLEENRTPEFMAKIKQAAFEANVTPEQLQKLVHTYDKLFVETHKQELSDIKNTMESLEKDFEKSARQAFGERFDKVLGVGRTILETHVPAEIKDRLNLLDNNALIVLASVLDSVNEKFIKEDRISTSTTGTVGGDKSTRRLELQKQIWAVPAHKRIGPEYERLTKELASLYT